MIEECDVYKNKKIEIVVYPGLLQPLLVPEET
jgi:hypothetical protein